MDLTSLSGIERDSKGTVALRVVPLAIQAPPTGGCVTRIVSVQRATSNSL